MFSTSWGILNVWNIAKSSWSMSWNVHLRVPEMFRNKPHQNPWQKKWRFKKKQENMGYSYNYITSITSPTKQMKVLSKKPWVCFPCFFLYHGKMVCIPWPTSRSKELKTKPRAWSLPPVPSKAPVLRDPRSSKPVAATTVPPWASSQLGTGEILKERGTV